MALDPGGSRSSAIDLGTLSTSRLKQKIGGKDKLDFYKFSLSGSGSFNFSAKLKGLKANADLALLSSSGAVLQQSKQPDIAKESLTLSLTSATYYLRVKGSKTTTLYRLNLFATGTGLPTPTPGPTSGPTPGPTPIPVPNTAPVLGGSLTLSVLRGNLTPSSTVISTSSLNATDTQQTPAQLTYTLTTLPKRGGFYRSGSLLGAGSSFTQAEINAGSIRYQQQAITELPNSNSLVTNIVVSGNNAAWINGSGDNAEVYFYNGTTGSTTRVTNDSRRDDNLRISGETIVWDSRYSSTDRDIFYSVGGAAPVKFDSSISFNDSNPAISGNLIAFQRNDNSGTNVVNDGVWLHNMTSGTTTQIKTSSEDVSNIGISGTNVVWSKFFSGTNESDVQFWNGSTDGSVNSSANFDDTIPVISGNTIAFKRNDKSAIDVTNDGIWRYTIGTGAINQLESGTENVSDISISGTNVVWARSYSGSDTDVRYSLSGGTATAIDISSSLFDSTPRIFGSTVAFTRLSNTDPSLNGLYLRDLSTSSLTHLSASPTGTVDWASGTDGSNIGWGRFSFGGTAGFFYDGSTTTDSASFTISDGSLTTSGTLNLTIS